MTSYLKSSYILEDKITIEGIPAILFRPKEWEKPLPTVILYHGWSSNKELQRMRGFILSTVGYQVIIPDAIHHGERGALSKYDLEDAKQYFWDTILTNIKESNTIIDQIISKYDADPNRIGVLGHSMGGFTAAGIFTHNPNVKASVIFNGSCGWENFNKWLRKNHEISNAFEFKEIDQVKRLDPQNNLNLLIDRPILLLHGDRDNVVPIESQRIFYHKIRHKYSYRDRIKLIEYPNLNHFVTTNMMEECIAWFDRFL
ncbi:alpha/beta hydrolase family protein [Tepidimicrobium xylanilyticum]|uniref:Peptidase S9 prolyl oligopeptidase catalytic domain-containing protein n=1 Tax=Tepidimicrobium xylanilyticum TaxID=1123352 RepID=A0A1H2Q8Q0_9FIRM|nr:alpha/beta hydrolase [Tepidimicrobium xylanilyticum]GMG95717.1 hypothetical protein EN5CB1_05430 [Tepidimicrobium xylanilyticum]SDW03532.1 hypothetical protein SAMN05660923_00087 [Tepidimicrobium xylanilyticum]